MKDVIASSNKVLFPILNWGLGHATRSMVIIKEIINQGKEVIIASDGFALETLAFEFEDVRCEELPSYDIHYKGRSFALAMMKQLPKILNTIKKEHMAVDRLVKKHNPDLIISDNRYGAFHKNCTSILLTHQLQPFHSSPLIRQIGTRAFRKLFQAFDQIWVPDDPDQKLSGTLSDNLYHYPVKYIGVLSRLEKLTFKESYLDILLLLSGPEPSRSLFEQKLMGSIDFNGKRTLLIRGIKEESLENFKNDVSINVVNNAGQTSINKWINEAKVVICRSGYSSIMDLYKMNKKSIIIATTGQTEQIYLADHLDGKDGFHKLAEDRIEKDINQLIMQLLL